MRLDSEVQWSRTDLGSGSYFVTYYFNPYYYFLLWQLSLFFAFPTIVPIFIGFYFSTCRYFSVYLGFDLSFYLHTSYFGLFGKPFGLWTSYRFGFSYPEFYLLSNYNHFYTLLDFYFLELLSFSYFLVFELLGRMLELPCCTIRPSLVGMYTPPWFPLLLDVPLARTFVMSLFYFFEENIFCLCK